MKKTACLLLCIFMALSVLAAVPAAAVSPEGDSAEIPYYTHNYVVSDSYSAQPVNAVYSVETVLNSGKLGIEAFSELNDVCTDKNGDIYILDGKGSRLIIIDGKSYTVKNEIKEIAMPDGSRTRFEEAKGVYVHTDGKIYIADTKAGRVLVCNGSSCVNEILLPESSLIPDDFMYQPIKVTVDSAGYTYVLSDGSYYGAILYAPSGKFLGFYGANSVKNTVTQFIAKMWKKLTSTNAKRSASASRLPYQFTDLYADKDNFIYTATGKTSQTLQTGQIRQLSPGGANILDSEDTTFGDYYVGTVDNKQLTPNIAGIAVDDSGFIYCYDISYGRIYLYDRDLFMLAAFGGGAGKGDQKGTFSGIAGIDLLDGGDRIVAIDSHDLDITVFSVTEYGKLLKEADKLDINGDYDKTGELCRKILDCDSGNISAYYILAKSAMQEKDYKAALEYSKKGMSKKLYSQAFDYLRKDWLKANFNWLLTLLAGLIAAVAAVCVYAKKRRLVLIKNNEIKSVIRAPMHPAVVFGDIKRGKCGSVIAGTVVMAAFYITMILKTTSSGFLFRPLSENSINSLLVFARTIGFVILWSVTNWAIATLFGGIGKLREIYLVITYSLFPVVIGNTVYIVFSHMLNLTEGEFLTIFLVFTELLAVFMVIVGSVIIHDISFGRFVGIAIMTILGMLIVIFIGILTVLLLQQAVSFAGTIIREIFFR